jgi:DNA-binding transcriptional MerR regulator/effector-binding domain-containing protein
MQVLLSIGDFSRMTYLSVKALRHYHDVGLLPPAHVDPATGYRFYTPDQLPTAQVIRRFRDLGMSLDDVKSVLDAPDVAARNEVMVAHLRRMEAQLEQTQATVASLRSLLDKPDHPDPIAVEYRRLPPTRSLAITEPVSMNDIDGWWSDAFDELYAAVQRAGAAPAGPGGALYPGEFFEQGRGQVTAFVPIVGEPVTTNANSRAGLVELPAVEVAVTVHRGPFSELDQAYGALGTYVAERELGVEGPIREHYLVTSAHTDDESQHRTEVCWPVFHTTPRS